MASTVLTGFGTLHASWGALMLAVLSATSLWGISCMQTFVYFVKYPKDRLSLKLLVAWLWLLNTAHQALITEALYSMAIVNFGNVATLYSFPLEFIWQILILVLIALTSRLFFVYRIYMFSHKNIIFPLVLIPATLVTDGTSLAILVEGLRHANVGGLSSPFVKRVAYIGNAMDTALDISFASIMLCLLRKQDIGNMERSSRIIHRVTVLSILSGAWTAAINVAVIVTLAVLPNDVIWAALTLIISPLYCNAVLANINARGYIRGDEEPANIGLVFNLSALQGSNITGNRTDSCSSGRVTHRLSAVIEMSELVNNDITPC